MSANGAWIRVHEEAVAIAQAISIELGAFVLAVAVVGTAGLEAPETGGACRAAMRLL